MQSKVAGIYTSWLSGEAVAMQNITWSPSMLFQTWEYLLYQQLVKLFFLSAYSPKAVVTQNQGVWLHFSSHSSPEAFAADISRLMEDPFWLTRIAQQFPGTGKNFRKATERGKQQKETALVFFRATEAVQCGINTSKDLVH